MNIQAKCHFCPVCDGHGCTGELPGMGGAFESANFQANCAAWVNYAHLVNEDSPAADMRLAPITGSVENIGFGSEAPFYRAIIDAALCADVALAIGDGVPDEKLRYGIEALEAAGARGAVFCKPYPNERILERFDWAREQAEYLGVDIDSYNILTMRNRVQLEKKDAYSLRVLAKAAQRPFAIKGVFTLEDLELVRELKPDVVVVSNHGGRIETRRGATADFLAEHGAMLARHCGEIWVDGGIRFARDRQIARALGAKEVLIGRPFITALLKDGLQGIRHAVQATFAICEPAETGKQGLRAKEA